MDFLIGLLFSAFMGLVPMSIYAVVMTWFDRYEKEPLWLMIGVFLWGAIVAAGSAFILNTLFGISLFALSGSEAVANVGAAVISAPFVEESVKGLAVLIVFVFFRQEFDSVLDGILYGSLVGFGFAATENVLYIFNGFAAGGLGGAILMTVLRAIGIAFLHASLTSCTGLGFAVLRLNRGAVRYLAPLAGYGAAIGLHAAHNLLATLGELFCVIGLVFDWIGFFGLFAFILYLVWHEGQIMRRQLQEEVALGHITPEHYQVACSVVGQFTARMSALGDGRWARSGKFYDLLGELAFKKYQLARRGAEKEPSAPAAIERLRGQIAALGRSGV